MWEDGGEEIWRGERRVGRREEIGWVGVLHATSVLVYPTQGALYEV
jgi:hypothetical protein